MQQPRAEPGPQRPNLICHQHPKAEGNPSRSTSQEHKSVPASLCILVRIPMHFSNGCKSSSAPTLSTNNQTELFSLHSHNKDHHHGNEQESWMPRKLQFPSQEPCVSLPMQAEPVIPLQLITEAPRRTRMRKTERDKQMSQGQERKQSTDTHTRALRLFLAMESVPSAIHTASPSCYPHPLSLIILVDGPSAKTLLPEWARSERKRQRELRSHTEPAWL